MSNDNNSGNLDNSSENYGADKSSNYTIAQYLFDRIAEAGATEIFGVPGDYNLPFLDYVIESDKVRWVGNTNELNAAYCSDGYARERRFAAMITTFGVGELSAINGTAGSYAEYAPVLHIASAPKTKSQQARDLMHHSLGEGEYDNFVNMAAEVTVAHAVLTVENAATEIDRVIRTIVKEQRPGYLLLAPDVATTSIYPPTNSLNLEHEIAERESITSEKAMVAFKDDLTQFIVGKEATLLVDRMVRWLGLEAQVTAIASDSQLPYTTLAGSKNLLSEQSKQWVGTYIGGPSDSIAKDAVENAECLIMIGAMFTDSVTAGFTQDIDHTNAVDIQPMVSKIGDKTYAPLSMKDALQVLHSVLTSGIEVKPKPIMAEIEAHKQEGADDEPLLQNDLWYIVTDYLDETSLIFADQGTPYYGMVPMRLPEGATFYGQPLWGSIGFTLPASLGASIASPNKRGVLLIGDGSALLTVQDISIMLREKTNPIIILVNNSGYTIERAIHGENAVYNDIPMIDWQTIPKAFGASKGNSLTLKASTPAELRNALSKAQNTTDKLVFVEVMTDMHDKPPFMEAVAESMR